MKLSIKTIYGIQALFELAMHASLGGTKSAEMAEAQGIPIRFLEQILSALKKGKLVKSYRGRSGGYELSRPAREISLFDIIDALEGPFSLTGSVEKKGVLFDSLKLIEDRLYHDLKKTSLEDLIEDKAKKDKTLVYTI